MKNLKLILGLIAGTAFIVSCENKENTPANDSPIIPEDTITVEESVVAETSEQSEARMRWEEAERNLIEARKNGDKAAQAAAEKARDDAKTAWDAVKNAANETAEFVEDGAKATAEGVEKAANKVGETSEKVYHDTKDGVKKAANEVKEGADKVADDVKNIGK